MLSSWIQNIRNKQIQKAQDKEIKKIVKNSRKIAVSNQYCRIGKYLNDKSPQTKKVLELGCGPGKYVAMVGGLGYEVIGADPLKFDTWNEIKNDNIKFMDNIFAEKLPFQENYFDHALCLGALLYFDSPNDALKEIKRVTKKDGVVIIRTVNKNNYYTLKTGLKLDPASNNLYTMKELVDLLEDNGFKIEDSYSWGFWPSKYSSFWWWFMNVILPDRIIEYISAKTPVENRINLIVKAKNVKND